MDTLIYKIFHYIKSKSLRIYCMYIRFNKSTRNYGGHENYFFDSTHFLKRKYFLKLIILNLDFCGEIGGVLFSLKV